MSSRGGLIAAGCGGVVAQLAQQEGGVAEGEDVLELGAAAGLGRVAGEVGGPVDEGPVLGLVGEEVAGVHLGVHGGEQVNEALMHALQVIQRAGVQVVLVERGDPQRGVAGDGVDMVPGGAVVQQAGERVFHQEAVGEDVVDDAAGDVQIAGPASAVALGRVPDAVLHAEMRGVGPGLPDFVEQRVGGLEAAAVGDGIEDGVELDGADLDRPLGGEKAHARVAEGRLGAVGRGMGRQREQVRAQVGMVQQLVLRLAVLDGERWQACAEVETICNRPTVSRPKSRTRLGASCCASAGDARRTIKGAEPGLVSASALAMVLRPEKTWVTATADSGVWRRKDDTPS